ncbi:MAG: C40 family peptidase [Eubacteriales bacterium]|nr:C40 family peptidase [Eubacteriales bacterium]
MISFIVGFFGTLAATWDPASDGLPDAAYVANTTVQWAEYIAENDSHGYNDGYFSRWGPTDYSNITFVVTAFDRAGLSLKKDGASSAGDLYDACMANGFLDVKEEISAVRDLKKGDLFIKKGSSSGDYYLAIYCGDRKMVRALYDENGNQKHGEEGDQTGSEISIVSYTNKGWDYILRYYGDMTLYGGIGQQIAEYAQSFVGRLPYVYGGTSLVTGADCSGFVQAVYAHFGYSIPRTAGAQYAGGRKIGSNVNDWQPGDLIYYSRTGSVQEGGGRAEHIVIYIGNDVVATKQYGITLFSCDIKEYPKNDARPIGKASSGNLVYILEVAENGWYYVESGDVRGFIDPGLLLVGDTAEALFSFDEEDIRFVEELVQPQENESLYYSFKSVKIAGCTVGRDIAETAMRYVGKLPYVYGGTSLQYGADCSGFVQSVFASYGVILPRTAEAQGVNGLEVRSLEEAKVGDVVYYSSGPHVGIYIGNGMVVQCSGNSGNNYLNPGKGPTISFATYMPITSIRRYLIETGDTRADGGNRLDLTTYSQEQLELIWAIVAQEDNGSYEGALAVITSAMNRTESGVWGYAGGNALAQLMAPGQYCYSIDNYWKSRLNGNVPEYVKQAVNDCLKRGIRNHNYTCFRSTRGKTTGASAVQIGGNWFFGA